MLTLTIALRLFPLLVLASPPIKRGGSGDNNVLLSFQTYTDSTCKSAASKELPTTLDECVTEAKPFIHYFIHETTLSDAEVMVGVENSKKLGIGEKEGERKTVGGLADDTDLIGKPCGFSFWAGEKCGGDVVLNVTDDKVPVSKCDSLKMEAKSWMTWCAPAKA